MYSVQPEKPAPVRLAALALWPTAPRWQAVSPSFSGPSRRGRGENPRIVQKTRPFGLERNIGYPKRQTLDILRGGQDDRVRRDTGIPLPLQPIRSLPMDRDDVPSVGFAGSHGQRPAGFARYCGHKYLRNRPGGRSQVASSAVQCGRFCGSSAAEPGASWSLSLAGGDGLP